MEDEKRDANLCVLPKKKRPRWYRADLVEQSALIIESDIYGHIYGRQCEFTVIFAVIFTQCELNARAPSGSEAIARVKKAFRKVADASSETSFEMLSRLQSAHGGFGVQAALLEATGH